MAIAIAIVAAIANILVIGHSRSKKILTLTLSGLLIVSIVLLIRSAPVSDAEQRRQNQARAREAQAATQREKAKIEEALREARDRIQKEDAERAEIDRQARELVTREEAEQEARRLIAHEEAVKEARERIEREKVEREAALMRALDAPALMAAQRAIVGEWSISFFRVNIEFTSDGEYKVPDWPASIRDKGTYKLIDSTHLEVVYHNPANPQINRKCTSEVHFSGSTMHLKGDFPFNGEWKRVVK